jgi:hypothetical protein
MTILDKLVKPLSSFLAWAAVLAMLALAALTAGGLGALTMGASLRMLEVGMGKTAFVFNGLPWLYVIARFVLWIRENMRRNREAHIGMPES